MTISTHDAKSLKVNFRGGYAAASPKIKARAAEILPNVSIVRSPLPGRNFFSGDYLLRYNGEVYRKYGSVPYTVNPDHDRVRRNLAMDIAATELQ